MRTIRLTEHENADQNSHPDLAVSLTAQESALVESINATGRLEVIERKHGLQIKTNRYVGAIAIGPLSVQIRPKLGPEHLPTFLRYALNVRRHDTLRDASVAIAELGFVDLIAMLFLDEVDALIQSGLRQEYRTRGSELISPKGRIQFGRIAVTPPNISLALPCRYDERTHDITLNRLLLATLNVLRGQVSDYGLAFDIHARSIMLAEMCATVVFDAILIDSARASLDRMSQYYERGVDLAELILRAMGVASMAQESVPMPGFLFDMAMLFESFVARLCREYAPRGMVVDAQVTKRGSYEFVANPYKWRLPGLRPDIVVRNAAGEPLRVVDTKYKVFGPGRPVGPADLYQLTLYSLGFDRNHSVPARIIYPGRGASGQDAVINFRGFGDSSKSSTVTVTALDLAACASALVRSDKEELTSIVAKLIG
jgi:5-methylcytosine-specific restriction enzyme subunit McrC